MGSHARFTDIVHNTGWDDGILKADGGMSLGEKATLTISRFVHDDTLIFHRQRMLLTQGLAKTNTSAVISPTETGKSTLTQLYVPEGPCNDANADH